MSVMQTLYAVTSKMHLLRRIININRRVKSIRKLEGKIPARREKNEAAILQVPGFAPVA